MNPTNAFIWRGRVPGVVRLTRDHKLLGYDVRELVAGVAGVRHCTSGLESVCAGVTSVGKRGNAGAAADWNGVRVGFPVPPILKICFVFIYNF